MTHNEESLLHIFYFAILVPVLTCKRASSFSFSPLCQSLCLVEDLSDFHLLCSGGFFRPLGLSVLSVKTSSGQIRSAGFQAVMKGHHFLVTDLPIKVMRLRSAAQCDPAASGGNPAELTSESEVSELTLLSKLVRRVRSEGNFSTSVTTMSRHHGHRDQRSIRKQRTT